MKYFLARLRWGSLSPQQKEQLETMSLGQVIKRPYLCPKLHKHY
jgi:hypothetical protein